MSVFDGKWKRVSATNVDAMVQLLAGDNPEKAGKLKAFLEQVEVVEEYHVTDSEATRKVYVNGELKQDQTNKFGVELERETLLGKSKIFVTRKSDNVIEVKEATVSGHEAMARFMVSGNKLTLDYTMNNITCSRVYEKC